MKLHEIVLTERITFDDREFVRSHGKKPRGTGLWIFRVEIPGREDQVIEVRMKNLVVAKKEVSAQLADVIRLDPKVFVLP